jgi:phosphoserine phosphatase
MAETDIEAWKRFEIQALRKICEAAGKEFVVLDNTIADCIDYFETLLLGTRPVLLSSVKIAERIIDENRALIRNARKIILLDGDRTMTNNDASWRFCELLGIGKETLDDIYRGGHYSLYQFFRAAKLYATFAPASREEAARRAGEEALINEALLTDILQNGAGALTIGITSGILETWRNIQTRFHFPAILAGGSNLERDRYIVGRAVKYHLARLLRAAGKYVIAVGDSDIDLAMLEASDRGFIVAQEKRRPSLERYFQTPDTKIMQLAYSVFQYDGLETKQSLFSE